MPLWKGYEEFTDCEEVKQENSSDVLTVLENMDAEDRKTAYQRFHMISGILPFIANENLRTQAIKKVAEDNPFIEWIGAAIRADAFGYVCAGRPAF